jgi:hypothetical protein
MDTRKVIKGIAKAGVAGVLIFWGHYQFNKGWPNVSSMYWQGRIVFINQRTQQTPTTDLCDVN